MDAHTDIYLTRGDVSQNTSVEGFNVDHGHEPSNTALKNEDSVLDNLNSPSSNVHVSLVTNGSDIEAHERQSLIHHLKCNQEPSDIQSERNTVDREHSCTYPQSDTGQVILPTIPKEVFPSDRPVVPAGAPISLSNNDAEATTIVCVQESPLPPARTVSVTPPPDEGGTDPVDYVNSAQMVQSELDHVQTTGLTHLTDEEKNREEFDDHFLPSLPPSSSPPQLFSSSPCASSQSSVDDIEPSKMVLAVEAEGCASPPDYTQGDCVVQDDSHSESEDLHSYDAAEVGTSPETDKYCSQLGPTPYIEGDLALSRKRTADSNESYSLQPSKRPKLDSGPYLPPAPKRATLASQQHQLKKLTAPFRPPLRLPVVTEVLAQTMDNRKVELITNATLETSHNKIYMKGTRISSQHKALNTSKSVTQFKSPLVNGIVPADSRIIRLTPALQALERKLQSLKRAIKVKEDREEEVLTKLAEKWTEAGREVAYDVWDAIKDAGDFTGKATFVRKSYGWESTNEGNALWGWDTKPGDASEESRDIDPSETSCTTGPLAPEEDEDVGCNTLGTMLRQLGIAPEIFGWDDDKETFSD